MIVVDTSAMIDLLSRSAKADRIEALLDDDVTAPDAMVPEVVRWLVGQTRSDTAAHERFEAFVEADIQYVPVWPYARRIWELCQSVSAYDACYVAIAEALDCALLTTDTRLGGVNGVRAPIIVV